MLAWRYPNARRVKARDPDARRRRLILFALLGLWGAALVLAGVAIRVRYGDWLSAGEWLAWTPVFAFVALPWGLLDLIGIDLVGSRLLLPSLLVFWGVMIPLHVWTILTGEGKYVAIIAILLAPAAWNWAITAMAMVGI
jgi:hypothetical protein